MKVQNSRGNITRWQELQLNMGRRLAKRLFEELTREVDFSKFPGESPRRWSLRIAYLMATLIYGLSVALGVLGLWVLWRPWPTLLHPIGGAFCLMLAWIARPRPAEAPHYLLKRSDFPTLYALTDRIAGALRAPAPQAIAYAADFNANYRQAGWRGRAYIELGSPLLAALNSQERLAVIAHELAHGVNQDPLRSIYLQGAVKTLATWGMAFRPRGLGTLGDGMPYGPVVSLIGIPFELVMLAFSELILRIASGFKLLVLRQSQRAEYLADRLAASVVGSRAMWQGLEKLYLEDHLNAALRRHALTTPYEPLGDTLKDAAAHVKPEELEFLRQESLASEWQVDSSHPPTALRVKMLQSQEQAATPLLMSEDEALAFAGEVERIVKLTERELIDRQLEAAYQ